MTKSSHLIKLANEAVFRIRLVQSAQDEYHLETVDGNVKTEPVDRATIEKQLADIEAINDDDFVQNPANIIDGMNQGLPFNQIRGQVLSTIIRADQKAFRKLV